MDILHISDIYFIIAEFGSGSQHLLQIDGHWNMQIIRRKIRYICDSCEALAEIAKGTPSGASFGGLIIIIIITIF